MNILTILLQEAQPKGSMLSGLFPILLIMVVFVLFFMLPQRKKAKEQQKFRDELKKGDKVVTIGGIRGTVAVVKDSTVILKVDDNTRIEFNKNAISAVLNKKEETVVEKPAKKSADKEKIEKVEKPAVEAPKAEEPKAEEAAEKAEN